MLSFLKSHLTKTNYAPSEPCPPSVASVSASPEHLFSKPPCASITLVPNLGVLGDSHCGELVQHLSRQKLPVLPANLRQVHLIHEELLAEVGECLGDEGDDEEDDERGRNRRRAHVVRPGDLGENVLTRGLNLLELGEGTKLIFHTANTTIATATASSHSAPLPTIRLTGLRNPCYQIDKFSPGLQERMLVRGDNMVGRKCGVMAVVEVGGEVAMGMWIEVVPADQFKALEAV